MINVSKLRKEVQPNEQFTIDFLNEHNFNGRVIHQWTTDILIEVEKDNIKDKLQISYTKLGKFSKKEMEDYLKHFLESFEMKCEIAKLKEQLKK